MTSFSVTKLGVVVEVLVDVGEGDEVLVGLVVFVTSCVTVTVLVTVLVEITVEVTVAGATALEPARYPRAPAIIMSIMATPYTAFDVGI